jgi:hypothetical protein
LLLYRLVAPTRKTIEEGVLLSSPWNHNYFHWMIEAMAPPSPISPSRNRLIEFFQEGEDNNCSNRLAAVSGLRYGLLGCQLGGQAKAKLPVLGATGVA